MKTAAHFSGHAALGELNEALKSPPPAIENKANIDLVIKYYDKLQRIPNRY